ncbi:MAG: DUF4124 domain-containing protein [Sedimenticola sp.]|nr:DUF4124 domain-containing protein [Sedimenticola sp.]
MNRINRYGWLGLLLGPLCGLLFFSMAQAAVYRWVDEQGRVQYGDRPPLDQQSEELKIKSSSRSEPAAGQPTQGQRQELRQKLLDSYQEERAEKREARKKREEQAEQNKMRCAKAKNRLRDYENSSALYELQPDGSRTYLSKAEFEATLKEAREAVKRLCPSN